MPEGFTNRKRLTQICKHRPLRERRTGVADCRLDIQVAGWVTDEIAASWEALNAENTAKPYLDRLRRHFTILTAVMEPDRNGNFTRWLGDDTPMEPHLVVSLTQPDFTARIEAFLPFRNGKVENVEELLASTERCKGVMLSASWLKPYISDKAKARFELRFNHERFFPKRMKQDFSMDMGRNKTLVNEVEAAWKDACVLRVAAHKAREDWLILPDGRMVLWRFSSASPILEWSAQGPVSWPCRSGGSRCAGAVVSADGKLATN
jgi:hypothetical protein